MSFSLDDRGWNPRRGVGQRGLALIATLAVELGVVAAIVAMVAGPDAIRAVVPDAALRAVDFATPPPEPRPAPQPAPRAAQAGEAARKAIARPVPAPKAPFVIATMPAPPVAATGSANTAGMAQAGNGSGAASSGTGGGAGGAGTGQGGGGSPLVQIAGNIDSARDFPRASRDLRLGHSALIVFTVGVDGRAHDCRVRESSGDPQADAITCNLAEERFRFRPATNAAGDPVAHVYGWRQKWFQ